jgi:hypothetical protein
VRRTRLLGALAGIAGLGLALGAPARAQEGAEEVLACMRRNAPQAALVQTIELASTGRDGKERTQTAKLSVKRGDDGLGRLLLRVEEPADVRGTAFLLLQKQKGSDMFVYLPELKRVRRVSARQLGGKLLGSDFSYEDLQQLFAQGSEGETRRLPDAEKDGRAVYALEATPAKGSGSEYRKITSLVDRESCLPLEIVFYAKGEAPRKRLTVDPARITKEGAVHVPRLVRLEDLERETESRLITHAVTIDPSLRDSLFTSTQLETGRE